MVFDVIFDCVTMLTFCSLILFPSPPSWSKRGGAGEAARDLENVADRHYAN